MKGVILAGGTGSRLYPCTRVTNKHLLPIYDKPMIYYPLRTLSKAGLEDILIVTGKEDAGDFLNLLGSGKEFGVNLTVTLQEEAGGIAQALNLAKNYVGNQDMTVILGDNIIEEDISKYLQEFRKQKEGARIFLKGVPYEDAKRFGCAVIKDDKVAYVEEKPKEPKSTLAMVGLYMFDSKIFEIIKNLKPSARGELEITDAIRDYVKNGNCYYSNLKGFWSDAGTFDSLFNSATYVKQNPTGFQ